MSLISHSVSGLYKTITKILSSIMKILASMTLDDKYIHERSNKMNRAIKNINEAFVIGLSNLS